MINNKRDILNVSPESVNSSKVDEQPIFSETPLLDNQENSNEPYKKIGKRKKIDKNLVLDTIRNKAPISISDLKRELDISYGSLWAIVREFEFVGLIQTKEFFDEQLQNHFKIISIPEIKKEVKEQ